MAETNRILTLQKFMELTGNWTALGDFLYSNSPEEDKMPVTPMHGESPEVLRNAIAAERIKGGYSLHPYDVSFITPDGKVVVIDEKGAFIGTNKKLGTKLGRRKNEFTSSLPVVDRQEITPVTSMISDESISPDSIYRYLGGAFPASDFSLDPAEKEKLQRVSVQKATDFFGKYISVLEPRKPMEIHEVTGELDPTEWGPKVEMYKKLIDNIKEFERGRLERYQSYFLIKKLEKHLAKDCDEPKQSMQMKMALTGLYLHCGMFKEALLYLKEISENEDYARLLVADGLHPDRDSAMAMRMNDLGYALLVTGQTDEAISALERGLQQHIQTKYINNNLGTALQVKGEYGPAIEAYSGELEINPGHPTAERSIRRVEGLQEML